MKFFGLLLIAALFLYFAIPGPHLRFGKDVVFYSDDVDEFVLPNGKTVITNDWYHWEELIGEKQEFFLSGSPEDGEASLLGILGVEAFSRVTRPVQANASRHVDVNNTRTTVDEENPGGSYQEFWVKLGPVFEAP